MDIFRTIAKLLIGDSVKRLFMVSNSVRQRFLPVFMELLWFHLTEKRRPPKYAHLIENLKYPPQLMSLGAFNQLKRVIIDRDGRVDLLTLPPTLTSLTIDYYRSAMDIGCFTKLEKLEIGNGDGRYLRFTTNHQSLTELNLYDVSIKMFVGLNRLVKLHMHHVTIHGDFKLHHTVQQFSLIMCVSGVQGRLILVRGGEERPIDVESMTKICRNKDLGSGINLHRGTPIELKELRGWIVKRSGVIVDHFSDEQAVETINWWNQ